MAFRYLLGIVIITIPTCKSITIARRTIGNDATTSSPVTSGRGEQLSVNRVSQGLLSKAHNAANEAESNKSHIGHNTDYNLNKWLIIGTGPDRRALADTLLRVPRTSLLLRKQGFVATTDIVCPIMINR